jgi:hypothetical protein
MLRAVAVLLAALSVFPACASRGARRAPEFDREQARREVYAAVLRQEYGGPSVERFVINPLVARGDAWGTERLPRLRADTRRDYVQRRGGARIPEDLDAGRRIVWFTDADWGALQVPPTSPGSFLELEERWLAFHAAHPHSAGNMSFSDIGFSADGTQALLHVWTGSAGLSGHGQLVLLERAGAGWRVVERTTTVVA